MSEDLNKKPKEDTEEITEQEAEFLDVDGEVSEIEPEVNSNEIRVSNGQALSLSEAINFTSRKHHQIILIAGTKESGKTSLIANYYLDFQLGNNEEIMFAGSHTLVGFEQRCWQFRTASMRMLPKTPRTSLSDNSPYLHLQVLNKHKQIKDILFCDVAGEKFINAADSTERAKKLIELKWANHFVLLIDGLEICLLDKRQSQSSRIKQLLFRLIDAGILTNNTFIEIVFSKADLFDATEEEIVEMAKRQDENLISSDEESIDESEKDYYPATVENTADFIEDLKKEISSKLQNKDFTAEFFKTSAYNIYGSKTKKFDNKILFDKWLNDLPSLTSKIKKFCPDSLTREIHKFHERELFSIR